MSTITFNNPTIIKQDIPDFTKLDKYSKPKYCLSHKDNNVLNHKYSTAFDFTYKQIEKHSGCIDNGPTNSDCNNGLLDAIITAYSKHYALQIRPDDLWITILCSLMRYVDSNAEAMRHNFVKHEGQQKLVIDAEGGFGTLDIDWMLNAFSKEIQKNVKDKDTTTWLECNFTTTDIVSKSVSHLMIMSGFKSYFNYTCVTMCGLPEVTLLGTREDYLSIKHKVNKISSLNDPVLKNWVSRLNPVLDMFIATVDYCTSIKEPKLVLDTDLISSNNLDEELIRNGPSNGPMKKNKSSSAIGTLVSGLKSMIRKMGFNNDKSDDDNSDNNSELGNKISDSLVSKHNLWTPKNSRPIVTSEQKFKELERFWNTPLYSDAYGSGSALFTGWLLVLSPFNKYKGDLKYMFPLNSTSSMISVNCTDLMSCILTVPVHINDNGTEFDTELYGGLFGPVYDTQNNVMHTRPDWVMIRK